MKQDPVASVRWFGAEQSLAWALQAYYAACKAVEPPPGQSFVDRDGETWASKGDFLHAFHSALTVRLNLAAYAAGDVPPSGSASEQLGWPDKADPAGKVAFFDYLTISGLPLPENQGDNAVAGEIA
ncbi:MAG TPA: hypothetical protein VJL61_03955 [Rhodanobacteraceae bacterium]|nr:hypothetical protein [Rhodanobacteraceae bacterium]